MTTENIYEKSYDCIIVGAGLSGLSTGLYLSNLGYKILIIEQESQVGGYAVNFQREKYRFEGSLHSITGCKKGGMNKIFTELGLNDQISCKKIPNLEFDYDFDAKTKYEWTFDEKQFVNEYCRKYPSDANDIRKFFKMSFKMGNLLNGWNDKKSLGKLLTSMRNLLCCANLFKYLTKNTLELMNDYFSNQKIIDDILGFPHFTGSEASEMSAIVFFATYFEKFNQGSYYIEGGSGHLTQLMAKQIKEKGGTILLNSKVVDVDIDEKLLKRIIVKPRSKKKNPFIIEVNKKPIVYCCDPHQFKDYLAYHYGKSDYFGSLHERNVTDSIFAVYLGLDMDVGKIYPNYTNTFRLMEHELDVIIYSNIDPTCCPENHSVMTIIKFMEADNFERLVEMDDGTRGKNYKVIKELITQEVIEELDVLINHNIKDHIEVAVAATPITYNRYTSNIKGSVAGSITSFRNVVLKRMKYRSKIKNLFFASQWIGLGGGYHNTMQTGIDVSKLVSRMLKKKRIQDIEIQFKQLQLESPLQFEDLSI